MTEAKEGRQTLLATAFRMIAVTVGALELSADDFSADWISARVDWKLVSIRTRSWDGKYSREGL